MPKRPWANQHSYVPQRGLAFEISEGLVMETAYSVGVHIRWMIDRDMPDVLAIERLSFPVAWTEEHFRQVAEQRHVIPMIAEHGDRVVGFMIYELRERSFRIMNFAVHPDWRRVSIGEKMIRKLIDKLSTRRSRLKIKVRERNLIAQLFFARQGFRATGVLRGYFEDTDEDAIEMIYRMEGESHACDVRRV